MSLIYNWEINFPLLLTIILTLSHGIITPFLIIRRNRLEKIRTLEPLYPKAKYLIDLPILKKNKASYTNEDKIIEQIVKRKHSDYINDVDIYWTYYGKSDYPELDNFGEEQKNEYIKSANEEYKKFFYNNFISYKLPLSPAYDYENSETKKILDEIILSLQESRSSFPKEIINTIDVIEANPPGMVHNKYKAQMSHDPEYFLHNDVHFIDPYRTIIFQIRDLYDKYSRNMYQRIILKLEIILIKLKYNSKKKKGKLNQD